MNRILHSLIATIPFWMAACQSLPEQDAASAAEPAAAPTQTGAQPDSLLLSDAVYSVLAGDIASQRSDYAAAYKHYFYAARLGRHSGLAELATKAALAARDEAAAQRAVEFWLGLAPDNLGALQVAALLRVQAEDLDGAAAYLKRVAELQDVRDGQGYLAVVRMLTNVNKPGLRLELMRRLVNAAGENADAYFALGIVELGAKNHAMAEQAARSALTLRPKWSEARVLLVRALAAQDKRPEARKELESFLGDAPGDTKLRASYARLLVEMDDLNAAKKQFKRLLRDDADDADALFALGVIGLQQGDEGEAKGYFERLYESGENKDEAAYYLGQIAEREKDLAAALKWYQQVDSAHVFEARVRIARIHANRGEVDRAREIIQQMRTHAGGNSIKLDVVEAEVLRAAKYYQAAMDVLGQALSRHPDDAELLYARGLTAAHVDRIDILEHDMRRLLEQDPNNADALNALGYTLADQTDRHEEALGYIRRALALNPDSPAVLDSMGWVQYRLGNHAEALSYLKRAMDALVDPEIAAHLGEVLWVSGNKKGARTAWRKGLEADPDDDYLLRVLERFGEKPDR
jgi:tetratricopeptide (TPR) repeat protein